jgi:hypothetical protein
MHSSPADERALTRPDPAAPATRLQSQAYSVGRRLTSAPFILAGYVVLALVVFSSSWVHPSSAWIGDGGDAGVFSWFYRWPSFALAHGLDPLTTNYADYPDGANLMWNTAQPLIGILLTPVLLIAGAAAAFNVAETLGVAASAFCAFLLARRYVSAPAATVAGLVYGFSPLMMAQSLGHPHVTIAFVPPLLFLLLDEILLRRRYHALLAGALLGALAAAQVWIGEELLATAAFVGLIAVGLLAALQPSGMRSRLPRLGQAIAAAAVTFTVGAVYPLGVQFFGPQRVHQAVQGTNFYATDLLNFIVPTRIQAIAPAAAIQISERFAGNLSEWNGYIGIPLLVLMGYIAFRYRSNPVVRVAASLTAVLGVLTLGATFHIYGTTHHLPTFILALAFPLLEFMLLGRMMLYLTVLGWVALLRVPVLVDVLPSRLTLYIFLLAGLMMAVFLDSLRESARRPRVLGLAVAVLALLPLLPRLPYPTTFTGTPAFFVSNAVTAVPQGDVVLIAPYCRPPFVSAMWWQAASGMRFRMPEGYLIRPGPSFAPAPSTTGNVMHAIALGEVVGVPTAAVRQEMLQDLAAWKVHTIIVGPMTNQKAMIDLIMALVGRPPVQTGGIYVWWRVDPEALLA